MKKLTQKERILRHLTDFGGITSFEAFLDYGITRLSAVIFDLKEEGVNVADEWVTRKNRYGDPVRFKRYFVEPVKGQLKFF